MQDQKLDRLVRDYIDSTFQKAPHMATHVGIHDYDTEMPEGTLKAHEEIQREKERFYEKIKNIDESRLSFDKRIDREGLIHSLEVGMHEDKAHGRWRSQPTVGMQVSNALHPLFIKNFAPFPERMRRIAARMEKIPAFVENSRELLTDPVKIWVEQGISESKSAAAFIETIVNTAGSGNIDPQNRLKLEKESASSVESLNKYADWLQNHILPRSRENFAMKSEDFQKLIELRKLGMDIPRLLEFGEEMLEIAREKRRETASKIAPGSSIEEVRKMISSNHPATFQEALDLTAKAVKESREFVRDSGFATLPEEECLKVVETPEFARNIIPFGAYIPAGRFEKEQTGYYWMSRPSEGMGQSLEIHNMAAIVNTSVHEGYPGHHLQLSCANINESLARMLTYPIEFIEGWAHYCEEKVAQMGFSTEPHVMFERYHDMIWRAARIIMDVKISIGMIGFDEAVDMLQEILGFDRASCITEVRRYTYTPGYQLSYLVGKELITSLLEKTRNEAGKAFDLRKFHDTMLYAGNLPVILMKKVVRRAFDIEKVTV